MRIDAITRMTREVLCFHIIDENFKVTKVYYYRATKTVKCNCAENSLACSHIQFMRRVIGNNPYNDLIEIIESETGWKPGVLFYADLRAAFGVGPAKTQSGILVATNRLFREEYTVGIDRASQREDFTAPISTGLKTLDEKPKKPRKPKPKAKPNPFSLIELD